MNTSTPQPPAPQLALIALSKTMARDFTGWVEGAKSQTKFVVDMADHLVALKDIAESTQSRPEAELPELPEHYVGGEFGRQKLYTADQMRAYGQQCAAARPGNEFAPEWTDGLPPTWWEEWFIASLDNGDRVVLKPLPEEYTYDFTTADGTYFMKSRVRRWMQFPDTEFNTPAEIRATRPAEVGGDVWGRFASWLLDKCEGMTVSEEMLQQQVAAMLAANYGLAQPAPGSEVKS